MRTPHLSPYILEPGGAFTPDPDGCWHCAHNPGYPHRHWREKGPAPWKPNWLWRAAFRLYGDGPPVRP